MKKRGELIYFLFSVLLSQNCSTISTSIMSQVWCSIKIKHHAKSHGQRSLQATVHWATKSQTRLSDRAYAYYVQQTPGHWHSQRKSCATLLGRNTGSRVRQIYPWSIHEQPKKSQVESFLTGWSDCKQKSLHIISEKNSPKPNCKWTRGERFDFSILPETPALVKSSRVLKLAQKAGYF